MDRQTIPSRTQQPLSSDKEIPQPATMLPAKTASSRRQSVLPRASRQLDDGWKFSFAGAHAEDLPLVWRRIRKETTRSPDEAESWTLFITEARGKDYLLAQCPALLWSGRSSLRQIVESAVESSLLSMGGALPKSSTDSFDGNLEDQLRRIRLAGGAGLALVLPSLGPIQDYKNTLDPNDSQCLRHWIKAAIDSEVMLYVRPEDRQLKIYDEPVVLSDWRATLRAPSAGVERRRQSTRGPVDESILKPHAELLSDTPSLLPPVIESCEFESPSDNSTALQSEESTNSAEAVASAPEANQLAPQQPNNAAQDSTPDEASTAAEQDENRSVHRQAELGLRIVNPAQLPPAELWQSWVRELNSAHGPKPLATIERLFTHAYVPLRDAIDHGLNALEAIEAADIWAQDFAKSYENSFDALRTRAKRPMMVLDAPDLAHRVARMHGAEHVEMILIDGLSFGMGHRLHQAIRANSEERAQCAERFLLWSALPSRTELQLELLGRGPNRLRDMPSERLSEALVASGQSASKFRRIRPGGRNLLKLDLLADRLRSGILCDPLMQDSCCDALAKLIDGVFRAVRPGTLVMIFGDHGYAYRPGTDGRLQMIEGGSLPEEVLVPADAWIVNNPANSAT